MPLLRAIADRHGLKLVTDTAQAPGALINGVAAGTLADIGGFSLNYHKHIHCGEGGLLVTNDDRLAERLRLIRNHGEAVIQSSKKLKIWLISWGIILDWVRLRLRLLESNCINCHV